MQLRSFVVCAFASTAFATHAVGQRYIEPDLTLDGATYGLGPLNHDGSVMLVGRFSVDLGMWTEAGGIELISVPQAFEGKVIGARNGLSSDGSTIVGTYVVSLDPFEIGVFVWSPSGVTTHTIPAPYDNFQINWVSSNSRYIVGRATLTGTAGYLINDPSIWDLQQTAPSLLPPADPAASTPDRPMPNTVSNSGTAAGYLERRNDSPYFLYGAPALWAFGQSPEELPVLGVDETDGVAHVSGSVRAITPDGSWLVGGGAIDLPNGGSRSGALRWNEQGNAESLGYVDGVFNDDQTSTALGVSDDGSVIVGRFRQPAFRGDYRQYFVWTEQDGMRDLTDIIRDAAGVELDEYSGVHDIFVSGDGRVIAGTVFNSDLDPRTRSFVFELSTPCPADVNGDGQLSPNDFNAWILAYNSTNPACDQNGDGECRQNDFNAWILNFNAGC